MSITPLLTVAKPDPVTLAKIATLEKEIAAAVKLIMNSKLNYHDVTILHGVSKEVIAAMAEHRIITNTLKHVLHKARDNRIKDIKKGL